MKATHQGLALAKPNHKADWQKKAERHYAQLSTALLPSLPGRDGGQPSPGHAI